MAETPLTSQAQPDRIRAVLTLLRRETSYEAVAAEFGVSRDEVEAWEADFIAGGTAVLSGAVPGIYSLETRLGMTHTRLSQISALNAITQSLSAILDLDKLLQTTIDTLYWVFGYVPTISMIQGGDLIIKGGYALDGTLLNWYDARLPILPDKSVAAWVATYARPLNVPNVEHEARFMRQEIIGQVHSELAIPMICKGSVVGVLDVVSDKAQAFDSNDMSVLETIAFQVAVAIDNARLFETVRRRVAQLELIQSVTSKAIENFDVPAILDYAARLTHKAMAYSGVAIGLVGNGPYLNMTSISGTGETDEIIEHTRLAVDDSTVIGTALRSEQTVLANDVNADVRFALNPLLSTSQSELVVPIRTKGGLVGVINVESDQPGAFDETDVATLTLLADQLTIAIRGAELFQQTQAQLREISLFRRLADEAIVGIITRDANGVIEYTNSAAAEMFGFPDAVSMRGKSMRALYPAEKWPELDRKLCVLALRNGGWTSEVSQQRHNGESIVVDMSIFPISAPDGTLMTYGMVLQDATQRRELIDAIQRTSARFLAVLEATDDGIVVWDNNWRVLFVNAAAARLLDTPVTSLVRFSRDDPAAPALLRRIARASSDEQIVFPGEEERICICRNLPWYSDQAAGHLTVIHDISSQILLEQSREELTTMLVHDLRGPLTSVVGGLDLAKLELEEGGDRDTVLSYLALANRGGTMVLDMTNSLLDIRRLETGTMVLKSEPLQIDSILDDVLNLLSNNAQSAQITLEVLKDQDLPVLVADNGMIRRALSNLLDNALKFTPDSGKVTISVRCEDEPQRAAIRFSVADTGPGVPEAFRKRIFEKYVQIPNQKSRRRGTGLGLTFCRLVAEAHHGRLWVEPRPDGGSIFSLVIANTDQEE